MRLEALLVLVLLVSICQSCTGRSARDTGLIDNARTAFESGDFEKAASAAEKACARNPRSPSSQYLLGASSLKLGNKKTARSALTRVIVMTKPLDPVHISAAGKLYKEFKLNPYSCLQFNMKPPGLVRWKQKALPLKIHLSKGREPHKKFTEKVLSDGEVIHLSKQVKKPSFVEQLPVAKRYRESFEKVVLKGLSKWDWAMEEKIITWELTDSASTADIVVFWCDSLHSFAGWTYHPREEGLPCLMLLSLEPIGKVDDDSFFLPVLQAVATHEFGHAWGLEHSPFHGQVMHSKARERFDESGRLIAEKITVSDQETLRALYSLPADRWFSSAGSDSR